MTRDVQLDLARLDARVGVLEYERKQARERAAEEYRAALKHRKMKIVERLWASGVTELRFQFGAVLSIDEVIDRLPESPLDALVEIEQALGRAKR